MFIFPSRTAPPNMSFRGSDSDRGNLQLGSEMLYHPINIEHFGYSMLIGTILKHSAVLEIAPQAFPSVTTSAYGLLAMTVVVDGRQHLTNRALN